MKDAETHVSCCKIRGWVKKGASVSVSFGRHVYSLSQVVDNKPQQCLTHWFGVERCVHMCVFAVMNDLQI